eukprot:339005-Rhodomonas_salina.1
MAVLGSYNQYTPVPDASEVQAVAPRSRVDRSRGGQWKFGRAGALAACCGAAVLVALAGTIDNAAAPRAQ